MRRLSRRLVLPIFGVFWITVLLFFWVTKKNLEVSTGPEVQTPKVRGLATRREGYRVWRRAGRGAAVCRRARSSRAVFAGSREARAGGLGAASR